MKSIWKLWKKNENKIVATIKVMIDKLHKQKIYI